MGVNEQINQIRALKVKYEEAVRAVGREGIQKLLEPLFEQYPAAKAVRWRQYTPYFNDGDPCTFRCGSGDAEISFGNEDTGDYEDGFQSEYDFEKGTAERAAIEAFCEALAVDDDIMLAAFGDHKVVTVSRDGVDVDRFDHE